MTFLTMTALRREKKNYHLRRRRATADTSLLWVVTLLFLFQQSWLVSCWISPQSSSFASCKYQNVKLYASSVPGRVEDIDQWIQWCSDSLKQARGVSLLEFMQVDSIQAVHSHERYAVVSHGIQEDPIFCYANAATLKTFQYTEEEFYQLPSRKSAPTLGGERSTRQSIMSDVDNNQVWDIPSGIRQRKDGSLFEFRNVILWNVYDTTSTSTESRRVGQCAVYDRALIQEVNTASINIQGGANDDNA